MTENVTQNTFGDRLAALTEAIAARPDALAEDHLRYAEFLLSGERPLEAIVGEVETEKVVSSTPALLVGAPVLEGYDVTYPVGSRAQDRDGDRWEKKEDGWWYLGKDLSPGWPDNHPWDYNAWFIA